MQVHRLASFHYLPGDLVANDGWNFYGHSEQSVNVNPALKPHVVKHID